MAAMRSRTAVAALLLLAASLSGTAVGRAAEPRFRVDLRAVRSPVLPALHSFTMGPGSGGRWLLVGGRTNGLHYFVSSDQDRTVPPANAFPVAKANRRLWVIDPAARRAWSAPLAGLPPAIADALSTADAQSCEADGHLYVVGGYGWSTQAGVMITFPTITAIDVERTMAAIVAGAPVAPYIQQISTVYDCAAYAAAAGGAAARRQALARCQARVRAGSVAGLPVSSDLATRVTGGGMERLGGSCDLLFGMDYEGLYSVDPADYGRWPVRQLYNEAVTALDISPRPLAAAVVQRLGTGPGDAVRQYHRRDLVVMPGLDGDGRTPILQALGGVFMTDRDAPYRQPVLLAGAAPGLAATVAPYAQRTSQYECAVVPLFDRRRGGGMTDLLLGGTGLYDLDARTGRLVADTSIPFITTLDAVRRSPRGDWSEHYRTRPMTLDGKPVRAGTDAKFLRRPGVPAAPNGVIYLDALNRRTLVGWMFGGILSETANPSNHNRGTSASSLLFEVWIDPAPPPEGYWASAVDAPAVVIPPRGGTPQDAGAH
jgi:hypothetical protein